LVSGKADVHALYDVLLNHTDRAGDVPILYSPAPFVNANLKSLQIVTNAVSTHGSRSLWSSQHTYYLELTGCILPSTLLNLCHLLRNTQQGNFVIHLSNDALSANLNAVSSLPQIWGVSGQSSASLALQKDFSGNMMPFFTNQIQKTSSCLHSIKCADGLFWLSLTQL